jgi:putative ABC transport system permease protein
VSAVTTLRRIGRLHLGQPGLTALFIITLAVGIGATSTAVSLVAAVLFPQLAMREPERLAVVWGENPAIQGTGMTVSYPDFQDWRRRARTFDGMAASALWSPLYRARDEMIRVKGASVSEDFFPLLGVRMQAGRGLVAGDFGAGARPVAVVSHGFWETHLGSARDLPTFTLDGDVYTVVGVLPAGAKLPKPLLGGEADVFRPLVMNSMLAERGSRFLHAVGRLRKGSSHSQAERELRSVASQLAGEHPKTNQGWSARTESLRNVMIGDARPALAALLGAALMVLLAACASVACMRLVQAHHRKGELALRLALGAGRARIGGQLLLEMVLPVAMSALLGLLLTFWAWDSIVRLLPGTAGQFSLANARAGILLASVVLSACLVVLVELFVLTRITTFPIQSLLAGHGGATTASPGTRRAGDIFLIAEIAFSLALLAGSCLILQSLIRLSRVELGFKPERLLFLDLDFSSPEYADLPVAEAALKEILGKVESLPQVEAAAFSGGLPLRGSTMSTGMALAPGEPFETFVEVTGASPRYFEAMGIPLVRGRGFAPEEYHRRQPVIILSAMAAKSFFPGQSAVGKRVVLDWNEPVAREVVGVVGDVRQEAVDRPPRLAAYLPYQEAFFGYLTLVVASRSEPAGVVSAARRQVHAARGDVPVLEASTMNEVVASATERTRLYAWILSSFACVAVVLVLVGIYAFSSFVLSLRTREFAIRIAFGAQRRDILARLLGHAAVWIACGVALGLGAGYALARLLAGVLFGVSSRDPLTFTFVALAITLAGLLAASLSARRAARIEPVRVLRDFSD